MRADSAAITDTQHSSGIQPGLQQLWTETTGRSEICVAVLDGPVDLSHDCFDGSLLTSLETVAANQSATGAAAAHGTHVAGVVFAQHTSSLTGIAPGCRGLIIPVFGDKAEGGIAPCSQLDLARAIQLAVQNGAQIINISAGQFDSSGAAEPVLQSAVKQCADQGVLIVSAAGNDGCECLHLPAALPSVLVVGAMDADGAPLEFSNWAQTYQNSGLLAPGKDITGAVPGGGFSSRSGTSFATPIVSGVAALLLSLQIKHGQRPNPLAVRKALLQSAIDCDAQPIPDCQRLLTGRLNVVGAFELLMSGTTKMSNTNDSNVQTAGLTPDTELLPQAAAPLAAVQPAELAKACPAPVAIAPQEVAPQATAPPSPVAAAPAPTNFVAPSSEPAPRVTPSACGCGGGAPPSLVYALGRIALDFGSEANRDAYNQLGVENPHDDAAMHAYLTANPAHAAGMTWTLEQESTSIYAIQPGGPFSDSVYATLLEFLGDQLAEDGNHAERVSIPGVVSGSVALMNGQTVPVIHPDIRGMYDWKTADLLGEDPVPDGLGNFLDRIYYEIRNLGVTSQDRAINFAATNAFQATEVYTECHAAGLHLDTIGVERSPICRPGSDCWDVKLTFFSPTNRTEQARQIHRFTIDVSGTIPVTVGQRRTWHIY